MAKPVAVCEVCGKTLSAEEISVGVSLMCPTCEAMLKERRPNSSCTPKSCGCGEAAKNSGSRKR